ncbi:MAG: Gldg family protein [Pseudomonadales bacterium]|jgi:ABC-2 type transport system permease protein
MRPEVILRVARKELTLFFASPIGYLFLLTFLAVTLFVFFWGEAFFARNVADVRPMFEWLPLLLIFLSAALTMRMWSEERRTGTLEFVETLPATGWEFVVGKFLACWLLLALALLLTLPLPVSVSMIADLDWGPVIAGYVAAMMLGGAYLAIGLFVSARTDSQIVSLILASFVCGLFYLVGNPVLTDLVGGRWADLMRAVGSGSRFDSITRGVLDFRDLYYYASLLVLFLALNVYSLEVQRWARDGDRTRHQRWMLGTGLLVANLLVANVWLAPLGKLRVDMTEGNIYTISDATRNYLSQLKEPLQIRGFFSAKTHPLLAPLVPQMRDLLEEFAEAGGDKVRVEIIDPVTNPEVEDEINTKYGIRPVPFQVADRYQSSLVNSYFDVLITYGDQYEVLGFRDLIEVKVVGESDLDVQLRNPEFDITRSIKKVLYGFQAGGNLFASLNEPVHFVGYLSADDRLPQPLVDYRSVLSEAVEDLVKQSGGKLTMEFLDPEAGDGSLADKIASDYGFQPMSAGLFDANTFYFYLTLSDGDTVVQIPLPEGLSLEATKRGLQEGLKRFAHGMLKSVALLAPENPPYMGMGQPQGNRFEQLTDFLRGDFDVITTQLEDGVVPEAADMLMVVDPDHLSEKQVFAIDQFLMRGGTVALATSPFNASLQQQSLVASPRESGLSDWLEHMGISMDKSFVMDPQNAAFPAPVRRQVGGFSFQELVMLDYPYFVDVRGDGINDHVGFFTGLPQLTLTWASPIDASAAKDKGLNVTTLLQSSPESWHSDSMDVMPRITEQGLSGFRPEGDQGAEPLAVMVEGRFDSAFAGKRSPLLDEPDKEGDIKDKQKDAESDDADADNGMGVVSSVIDRSPESARIILFASNTFLADQILRLIGSAEGVIYSNTTQLMANVADWTLEDQSLLSIRSRGHFNRTLPPLDESVQLGVEILNYFLAVLGIAIVYGVHRRRLAKQRARYSAWLAGGAA